jgi:hypothetical protein
VSGVLWGEVVIGFAPAGGDLLWRFIVDTSELMNYSAPL